MNKLLRAIDRYGGQRGAVIIYVAFAMFLLLFMAALAVDVGYNRVVRNQLQNAADAAALAACNRFYDRTHPPDLSNPDDVCPDWDAATNEVAANNPQSAIKMNSADNNPLQTGTTWVGWWDIVRPLNPDQWANPPSSPTCTPPTSHYGPAVRVTILKAAGQNSGAMQTFFGKIMGVSTIDVDASATAVAASPGEVAPNSIMPYAISINSKELWSIYGSAANPITLGDPYHCDASGCYAGGTEDTGGQFTTYLMEINSVGSDDGVRDTIAGGNPSLLDVTDQIWIEPGVKRTAYDNPSQVSLFSEYAGKTVALPVVGEAIYADTHGYGQLVGYIGFHVICVGKSCVPLYGRGNNEKIVMGYFTTEMRNGLDPVGPHFGPLDRCRIAR
jgi:hypothetical protein